MEPLFQLEPLQARLLGVLIEKSFTTPDVYPLTLNAATNGANQKSNRDPVLSISEDDAERALDGLVQKHLARRVFLGNSRVEKYAHRGGEMLGLGVGELAILAELLMRGPQTSGELRARAGRMTSIESLEQLATLLAATIDRGLVRRLPPAPGSRAERYAQLLAPGLHPIEAPGPAAAEIAPEAGTCSDLAARVTALESEVERLREAIAALTGKCDDHGGG